MTTELRNRGVIERQNPFVRQEEPQYTPAYGYSTAQGEVYYSYQTVRQERSRADHVRETQRDARSFITTSPAVPRPFVWAERNLPEKYRPSMVIGEGATIDESRQLYQNPIKRKPQVFDNGWSDPEWGNIRYAPQNLGRGVIDVPNVIYRNPVGTANEVQFSAMAGGVGGSLFGRGVKSAAGASISRAAFTEKAVTYGGLGVMGAGAAAFPEQTGRAAPSILVGGITFGSGYRSEVPRTAVTFSGVSGSKGELRLQRGQLEGFGEGKARATITQYGQTRTEDVPVNYLVTGAKTESGRYAVNVQTFGQFSNGKKTIPFTTDYAGTLNPRTGIVSLSDKQGTYFLSSVGKTTGGIRRTNYAVLQENRYNIPTVTETGRGVQGADSVSYLRFKPRSYKAENVEVFQMGRPNALTFEQTGGVSSGQRSGGTTKNLFSGFRDLEATGRYTQRTQEPFRFPELGRKGRLGNGMKPTDTVTEPFSGGRVRGGGRRGVSIEGLPVGRVSLPSRLPVLAFGYSNPAKTNTFIRENRSFRELPGVKPNQKPGLNYTPYTGTDALTGFDFTPLPAQTSTGKSRTGSGFSGRPGQQPPELPPMVLPPFGFGLPPSRGGLDVGSRGRGFKYQSDLTSSLLGVKGKRKKGLLSGLEFRPVA